MKKINLIILLTALTITPLITTAKESKAYTEEDVQRDKENGSFYNKDGSTNEWIAQHWEDAQKDLDRKWKEWNDAFKKWIDRNFTKTPNE
ncbi:hypothetical protein [Marinifilum flexuosum]|uniref:hypothetical protein n=1 Tax=Marinifilum flexuosum TaxID=1117708 RepID=UPI0024945BD6|nr:hypothetical protein [Marinifilum flexuosum]